MNKISILGLINEFNGLTKKDLIKKMLVFVETEFELTIAFLEYDGLYPVLHYLDDNMIIKSHQYNFLPQKSKELEVLVDVLSFKENDYFDGLSVYVKVPLETEDEDIGEIIFKIDHDESLIEGRKLTMNRLATEFSFLLNYYDLKTLKDDAVESLIKESQESQKIKSELKLIKEESKLLKDNNDFGVLLIDLKLNIVQSNPYFNKLFDIDETRSSSIASFLTQNELHSENFIKYLKKLSKLTTNLITNISLVNKLGKEYYFKVSGSYLKNRDQFFLKVFNTTSETVLTKRFANLKSRFDNLLKAEVEEVVKTSDLMLIEALKFFENKDEDFGNHLERVGEYSLIIAKDIFENNTLEEDIDLDYINVLSRAASLHDIGMLSIKESILFKDSKFTKEEFTIVKNHTIKAATMIDSLLKKHPNSMFLKLAKEIALGHHERYNGKGYPFGLVGKQIPLSARIVAFADVFDGLTTDRIYKKGLDLDVARMMIVDYEGKLLDPDIVKIYLKNEDKFIDTYKKYNLS